MLEMRVVMVSTVVTPSITRAGVAPLLSLASFCTTNKSNQNRLQKVPVGFGLLLLSVLAVFYWFVRTDEEDSYQKLTQDMTTMREAGM